MRTVQVLINIERFGPNAPNGKRQELNIYADANNEYEALCAAFYEALDAIQSTDGYLPSFGRRDSSDKNFPHTRLWNGLDQHLSDTISDTKLKVGDVVTFHIAQSKSPANYVILTNLFDGMDDRVKGGRVLAFEDDKKRSIEIAIEARKATPGRIAILSSYKIPHDSRIFPESMDLETFIATAESWAEKE